MFNRVLGVFIRLGVAPRSMYLLTVRGRKTGRLYTTPVSLIIHGSVRYLIAPYGQVNWVKNARASGELTLTRARRQEKVGIKELAPASAAPILKEYLHKEPITRPYFDVTPDSPPEAFEAEAAAHPVFELTPLSGNRPT